MKSTSEKLLHENEEKHELTKIPTKKLAFIPLVFLIYFQVSGGPYGTEDIVGSVGPLFAILGIIVFPILWSVPEALITAELSTAFPGNGGFVIWSNYAFGPFWGFLVGYWKYLSTVLNLSSNPLLCMHYIDPHFSVFSSNRLPHHLLISIITMFLSFINITGLPIVGYGSLALGILSYLPFLVITLYAIPQFDPSRWSQLGQNVSKTKEWPLFFNTLFWNLNCYDHVSTLVNEGVPNPSKKLPKAFLTTGLITCFAFLIPLIASTGAMKLDLDDWVEGYYTVVGAKIVGKDFKKWVRVGAFLSGIGVFQSQLSSCSHQLLGMTELGLLPPVFGTKSKRFDTPWVGIVISTLISIFVSYLRFKHVRSLVIIFHGLGALVEFAAFIYLRMKYPDVDRPFRVPVTKLRSLVAMCLAPFICLLFVICAGHKIIVYLVVALLTLLGTIGYFCMRIFQGKIWLEFNRAMMILADYENISYYDEFVK